MHAIDLRVVCILCFHAGKMNGKSILIYSKAAESDALCICTLGPTHALLCVTVCVCVYVGGGGMNLFIYVRTVVTNHSLVLITQSVWIKSLSLKYKN
jgi:hypothetical protein